MHRIGVTPMPPASSTWCFASCASAKWFFGALISSVSPSFTLSCMAFEPPRLPGSLSTPIR
jgi:hypothetical protein